MPGEKFHFSGKEQKPLDVLEVKILQSQEVEAHTHSLNAPAEHW